MARISRADVFCSDEVAIVHVMNRTVRRCFLMGNDPLTGKNFDHRKAWMEKELERLAACFGIDLLTYAILSNHFHLILRSRPDVVQTWSDEEIACRWLTLCPIRKDDEGNAKKPNENEIKSIVNNAQRLLEIRSRLSNISCTEYRGHSTFLTRREYRGHSTFLTRCSDENTEDTRIPGTQHFF